MDWIKRHAALATLLLVTGAAVVLFITGRLQYNAGGKEAAEAAEEAEEEKATAESANRIQGNSVVLDEESFKTSGIHVSPVAKSSLPVLFHTPGEVQLAEDRIAHVTPLIPGVIRALYRGIGDPVKKGSPLCLIESVELGDAKAFYVTAQAEVGIAEQNYTRWKQLFDKGLRTQNELIAVEAELTRAKLKREGASARLRGLGVGTEDIQALEKEGAAGVSNQYTLTSPIDGSVLQRNVTDGQSVVPSDQLFFVGDLSEIWVQAVAREQDLAAMRTGALAVIRIPNMPETVFRGSVTYIGQQVDEKTRTVPIRLLVRNSPATNSSQKDFILRPGLFTDIEIDTGGKRGVMVIPFSAVQSEGSNTYVFVQVEKPQDKYKSGNIKPPVMFEHRAVELGVRNGDMVEVMKGLQIGESVAVEHAYLLKGELEKSKLED